MSGLMKLTITVWGGKDLKVSRTADDKCDPFVELKLGNQKVKTKPTKMTATTSPVWNEKFVMSTGGSEVVEVVVVDNAPTGKKVMGEGIFKLDDFTVAKLRAETVDQQVGLKLGGKPAGSIKLVLMSPVFGEVSAVQGGKDKLKDNLAHQQTVSMVKPTAKATKAPAAHPKPVVDSVSQKPTALQRLDAADGKMDGKYFGHTIGSEEPRQVSTVSTTMTTVTASNEPLLCPNPKCGETFKFDRDLQGHMELCKFSHISCNSCQERFYRMDEDFHGLSCGEKTVTCPLECGAKMARAEVKDHIETSLLTHKYDQLESKDYLPAEHPQRIYGLLLRKMKELEYQLEIARKPGTIREYDRTMAPVYISSHSETFGEAGAHTAGSEWYRRYDLEMSALHRIRDEVNRAQRLAANQDRPTAQLAFNTLEKDRERVVGVAHEMVVEMEEALRRNNGKSGGTSITIEDCTMSLDRWSDHLEDMKDLLRLEESDWNKYGDTVWGNPDGLEEVTDF
eukprot:GGOE01043998.1.p1 GENE.GGOE01043998.1~~GGOE01043998.1.p1  ORF type:complete len:520 (-),score=118.47 GGOE01043998.1:303-1823(-)